MPTGLQFPPGAMWIGAMALGAYFYFRFMGPPSSVALRQTEERLPKVEKADSGESPAEYLRWEVEMHETARGLKAELDSKMAALLSLTRTAREEQQRLARLIEEARQVTS